jgi:hypothetical protein
MKCQYFMQSAIKGLITDWKWVLLMERNIWEPIISMTAFDDWEFCVDSFMSFKKMIRNYFTQSIDKETYDFTIIMHWNFTQKCLL